MEASTSSGTVVRASPLTRRGAFWFAIAGLLAVSRWALEFVEIQYYDPQSFLDYNGVLLQTGAGLTTGVALLVLWRNPPVPRGAFLIGLAGLGSVAQGLGNLFEDAFDWEWGVWGFLVGGVAMIVLLALAGVLIVSMRDPHRYAGVFLLLGSTGGMLGLGLLVMGLSWIAFSFWIYRSLRVVEPVSAG